MSRSTAATVVVISTTERQIIDTLAKIIPAAAASYEQCIGDLGGPARLSYRGAAHELREVIREVLEYLAPDREVMAEANFKPEEGLNRPTHRQKALYILRKRRQSKDAIQASEKTINLIDELGAQITRLAYTRGSTSAHGTSSLQEVRQLKMWVDPVLAELLEIHAQ